MAASPLDATPVTEREDDDGQKYINQYSVVRKLGKGAYGKVKLVRDAAGNEKAIKILNKSLLKKRRPGQKDLFENVLREVAIMKKLTHPNAVRLYEALDDPDNNKIFLVVEYLSGGTLQTYFEANPPNREEDTRRFLRDILCGVAYLHKHNVVHRDIKPENMLLDSEGRVKVADFGVSMIVSTSEDEICTTAGTPAFMAPECCRAEPYKGFPTDVWAVGISAYWMLFGQLPFLDANIMTLYTLIQESPIVLPRVVGEEVSAMLFGALEKDAAKRATVDDLKESAWVTRNGTEPLERNADTPVISVSDAEIRSAFKVIDMFVVMVRIKQRMGGILARQRQRSASQSGAALGTPEV